MRVSYSTLVKAKRAGRATSVRVAPTGTAVTDYQVPLGNRHSMKEAGVIGLPSWSDKSTQAETWVRVPRLSAICPRRVVVFDGGRGDIDRTMEFGDEFDGAALDTAKWTYNGAGSVSVSGGACTISSSVAGAYPRITAKTDPPANNLIVESRVRQTGGYTSSTQFEVTIQATGTTNLATAFTRLNTTNEIRMLNGDVAWGAAIATYANDTYYVLGAAYDGTSLISWVNRGSKTTWARTSYTQHIALAMVSGVSTAVSYVADWVILRKYVANEPLAGTAQPSATNRALSRPMSRADLIRACCT